MGRKGIIVVSSGTSDENAIKLSINAIEDKIKSHFPHWKIRRAFTSELIINKIRNRLSLKIDTVHEALLKMEKEEFTHIIVQPLHIIPGLEFEKTVELVNRNKNKFEIIKIGRPLLYNKEDYFEVVNALKNQIPAMDENEAVVLVGHGTKHKSNIYYEVLQDNIFKEGLRVYITTLGGQPSIYDLISKLREKNINKLILMPFMLVCGEHGKKDIAGDGENSYKSILEKEGFKVSTFLHGIGENYMYQEIYLKHLKDAIECENQVW